MPPDVGQHRHQVRQHLHDAAGDGEDLLFPLEPNPQHSQLKGGEQGRVVGKDAQFTLRAGGQHHICRALEQAAILGDDLAAQRHAQSCAASRSPFSTASSIGPTM